MTTEAISEDLKGVIENAAKEAAAQTIEAGLSTTPFELLIAEFAKAGRMDLSQALYFGLEMGKQKDKPQ